MQKFIQVKSLAKIYANLTLCKIKSNRYFQFIKLSIPIAYQFIHLSDLEKYGSFCS